MRALFLLCSWKHVSWKHFDNEDSLIGIFWKAQSYSRFSSLLDLHGVEMLPLSGEHLMQIVLLLKKEEIHLQIRGALRSFTTVVVPSLQKKYSG